MSHRVGDRVRVASRHHDGHHRTPGYLKGKSGTVVRVHGAFAYPETRAYGADGMPAQPLYLIGFDQHELWPDYAGRAGDRIYADVYEPWLEVVDG